MNSNSNGRIIATTSLLLLVATMIVPAAFADQNAVRSFSPGKVATMGDIPKGICGQVDLMLVVDDTGSMGGAIDNVKLNLTTVIDAANLADVDSARIGLITFKDDVSVLRDLSASQADVITDITALTPTDGGALPEASDEAKNTAVNNLPAAGARLDANGVSGIQNGGNNLTPWQTPSLGPIPPKATNMMILITDDESGGFSDSSNPIYQTHMGTLGTEAAAKGIHVGDVFVGVAEFTSAKDAMLADATNSNGIYTFAPSGAGTAQAIIDIIAQCGGSPPPPTVAGELLPINTMSLFISGLFTNSFWMLPVVAGIAGTGAFVIRSRMHKDQEN